MTIKVDPKATIERLNNKIIRKPKNIYVDVEVFENFQVACDMENFKSSPIIEDLFRQFIEHVENKHKVKIEKGKPKKR